MIKKGVELLDHDQIQVEKERGSLQTEDIPSQDRQLSPAEILVLRRQTKVRKWEDLNALIYPGCVISEADETVRIAQVTRNPIPQAVHVLRTVGLTPFHTEYELRLC